MSSPRTLENRLILACARTEPDIRIIEDLIGRGPDWEEIMRKTERWGVAPLVHDSLRRPASGRVPKPVTERLRHLHRGNAIRSIALREALRAILLRFVEASIPVIVLKGAAVAELVYGSPALRPMGDLDLLVQRRDLERVDELLHGMNYAPVLNLCHDGRHDIPYMGPDGFPLLEIHSHIEDQRTPLARIPIEDFWKRSRPVRIASVETLAFSHEDLLMHLVLHLATHLSTGDQFVGHLRGLCDIGEMCRRYGSAIDWRLLVKEAEAYKTGKYLYYLLCLARDLVGAEVPSRALTDLRSGFAQLPLEGRFILSVTRQVILSEDQATRPPWTFCQINAGLLSTRGPGDKAGVACRLAARSCQARMGRLLAQRAAGGF